MRSADVEKQRLLLETVRDKGLVIAQVLEPLLAGADVVPFERLADEVARFASSTVRVKLLFQPLSNAGSNAGFFFVAAAPALSLADLDGERKELLDRGILKQLSQSCVVSIPLALPLQRPGGGRELLTSITPIKTHEGCWALLLSHTENANEGGINRPYWRTAEVRFAGAIYLAMALLVLAIFIDLWRDIRHFGGLARAIRHGGERAGFGERNRIPELDDVAHEFDAMVDTLNQSAEAIRRAAEDNAHALKNPLAIIRQALELLLRRADRSDPTILHATGAMASSIDRLDGLIASARRLDQAMADLLAPPDELVDLTALVRRTAASFAQADSPGRARLRATAEERIAVRGGTDQLETVLENLIDNALSFTPPGGTVRIALGRVGRRVQLTVDDEGPGVAPDRLAKIFDRYQSFRPEGGPGSDAPHFGIGLWIVRRNVEAMGGKVRAENRAEGGLRVIVELPLGS